MQLLYVIWDWFIYETNIFIKSLTIPLVGASLFKVLKYIYQAINERREKRSLFPYFDNTAIREAKRNYIRTKCQNIDPANEINYKSSHAFSTKEDLLNFFLKKVFSLKENENRFYLILGDSGMGKSTFMLNLFSRYISLFNFKLSKNNIKLLPLGENLDIIKEQINKVEFPNNTILLLDGFDEIPLIENEIIKDKFDEIIDSVKEFKVVVITCRTHFFTSEKEEPFELKIKKFNTSGNGYHKVKKLYISPFDQKDVSRYINRIFHFYEIGKKRKANKIIENTYDLMVRPMLLSYIKEIINSDKKNLNSSFDIYETLIENWFTRESNKYEQDKRNDFRLNLIYFSYEVSKHIYKNYKKNGIYIPLADANKISNKFKINLNEIEIKSRSLLNRNSLGDYKFSHKSIYEFFLAYLAFANRISSYDTYTIEYNLDKYDQAKIFVEDIVRTNRVQFALPNLYNQEIKYNLELYERIIIEKNKVKELKIKWLSGTSFKVLR